MRSAGLRSGLRSLMLVAASLMLLVSGGIGARSQTAEGELAFTAVVVDDLMPKPVPLTDFKIISLTAPGPERTVRSDETGQLALKLPAGKYRIESAAPVRFRMDRLVWKTEFTVEAGKTTRVKVTDADATRVTAEARQVSDEAAIYQKLRRGVVTVEGEFGRGSGFVVDRRGIIISNQHVTEKSQWAAVRFGEGVRVEARIVEQDPTADVSVLVFNPEAYADFTVVPLAKAGKGPLAVEGEKVLAIGSPLHQEKILTTGIISKVEPDVFISDVNINPGNSGGPLLNMAGEAIGITTFGDFSRRGPGIGGSVAITRALPVLDRALQRLDGTPPPSAKRLPDISPVPIPDAALQDAAKQKLRHYEFKEPLNFLTQIATPFIRASTDAALERELAKTRNKRVKDRGAKGAQDPTEVGPTRFWERYALNNHDALVSITVVPVLKETSGSKTRAVFGALFGVVTSKKLEFRDDFQDMQLYRGDQLILPVRRQKDTVSALYQDWLVTAKDQAYGGIYFYDPSAFEPGQPLVLKVLRASNLEKWTDVEIDKKTQQKIWEEFVPWRQAVTAAR